jgi:gamma-glutamyltranspeptidase/glutathione hydrolase
LGLDERLAASGRRLALATPHPLATAAGLAAAGRGGNAIDAAVAAAVSLAVVYPHMCSPGGDVIALVAYPDGTVECLNASGAAGVRADAEALRREHGAMPSICPHAVTVPGAVSAWGVLAERAATMRLADLMREAIAQARDGVPVAPGVHRALVANEDLLSIDPGMRAVLFRDGRPLGAGETLRQPALAVTLAEIAEHGWRAFYHGVVARRLVAGLARLGVPLEAADLARHVPELTPPLRGRDGGCEVLTAPPNSQGLVLLEILAALERLPWRRLLGRDAGVLAEVFRLASLDRDRFLADPLRARVPLGDLLGPAHAAGLARAALDRAATGVAGAGSRPAAGPGLPADRRPPGDTVAVVAMDADGWAVSLIQSVFHTFGSGLLEPETGLVLHNRGASFSLDPASPNLIEPGKRPAHTLMPVLLRERGELVGAHGTMGAKAQPQIHSQLLLNLREDRSPADSLAAPRWVVGRLLEAGTSVDQVRAEPGVPAEALESIAAAGFELVRLGDLDEEVGHGQLVRRGAAGELLAATDPRCDGLAAAR